MTRPEGPRAVVFGGAGFIGTHLVKHLATKGYQVVVADIACVSGHVPEGVLVADVDVRKRIRLSMDKPDVVFNLAATHRTPGHPDNEYYDTNVGGALNVTAWCDDVGADQLVFTSSISVYGPTESQKDERSPLTPNTSYGRSKLLAEQIQKDWAERGARRLVLARPAVVFGPGEGGNFTRLAQALDRRSFVYPGRDDTVKACGYVLDLVRAMMFGLSREVPLFEFNFCYPRPYTIRDICEAFGSVAGFAAPWHLPTPVVDVAMHGLNLIAGKDTTGFFSAERVKKVIASTNISPTTLVESGFRWETDLESGLRMWHESAPSGHFA